MKLYTLLVISITLITSCGVINPDSPQPSPGKDGEENIFNRGNENSVDAITANNNEKWVYKGDGDYNKGESFCNELAFIDLPGGFGTPENRFETYSPEEQKMAEKLKQNPSLKQLFDSNGNLICEKQKIN